MRVYLDNCCFNRPFDNQKQIQIKLETEAKLYIQEKIKKQEIELIWSYILDYENRKNPYIDRKNLIQTWKYRAVADIDETEEIIINAERIKKIGIKTKDALHVACAVFAKCNYFITTDKRIISLSSFENLKIVNPIEFIRNMEEDNEN